MRYGFLGSMLAILAALTAPAEAALVIDGYSSDRHDRFAGGGSLFVGSAAVAGVELDFSGVARASNGFWVTMISPIHFLSAAHAPAGGTIVFHHDNSTGGATTTRFVDSGGRVAGTDIWLGELNDPIDPSDIAVYPIAGDADYTGDIVYQIGRGGLFGASNTTGFRVGRNRVSDLYEDVVVGFGTTDSLTFFDDSVAGDLTGDDMTTADLIDDETFLQNGDSGGPSFLLVGGELVLLGTHSFITEPDPDEPESPFNDRRASGDAYLPSYLGPINTLAGIPEPTTFGVGVVLSAWFLSRPRRGAVGRRRA